MLVSGTADNSILTTNNFLLTQDYSLNIVDKNILNLIP